MKCGYHPEREAVGKCADCDKDICNLCLTTTAFNINAAHLATPLADKHYCPTCIEKLIGQHLEYLPNLNIKPVTANYVFSKQDSINMSSVGKTAPVSTFKDRDTPILCRYARLVEGEKRSATHCELFGIPCHKIDGDTCIHEKSRIEAKQPTGSGILNSIKAFLVTLIALLIVLFIVFTMVVSVRPSALANVIPTQFEFLHIWPTKVNLEQGEQALFNRVNEERQNNDIHTLVWDENLASYSRKHSADMASSGEVYHDKTELSVLHAGENALKISKCYGGGGILPYFFLRTYRDSGTLWKDSVTVWMNSSGHRANILTSTYTYTGIGIAVASDGTTFYITQDFK